MNKMIFMNIGWMKKYQGWKPDDRIIGGGKWPEEHDGKGGELCNFLAAGDFVYGHVESSQSRRTGEIDRKIKIESLGGSGAFVSGVDVVWTARHPTAGKTCVVGWYRNAEVYRERNREAPPASTAQHINDGIVSWRVRARAQDAVCLDVAARTLFVHRGKGGLGQNQWKVFPDDASSEIQQFLSDVRNAIVANVFAIAPDADTNALLTLSKFDPSSLEDGRKRIERMVTLRQGQADFRKALLRAYDAKCAITGCSIPDVLEAAHIMPYRGEYTNHVTNGILLRADMHTLFDNRLIEIDEKYQIAADRLVHESYPNLPEKIRIPVEPAAHPNREALAAKWK